MQEYDYVIVGAGVAGCVLAARLTENPRVSVALLESGPDNEVEATEYVVGAYSTWSGPLNWGYKTLPQVGLAGRELDSPRGRVVGGSAAINGGSWSRGIAADYDAWGVEGWGWATALATFRAVEASDRGDGAWRGANGPMALETMPRGTFMTEAFRDASRELGVGETADHNGAVFEGFDRWETIFPGGRRRNTAKAYLEPARTRANLSVFTGATARRVVLGNGRSTGVQTSIDDKRVNIAARREVILAAGAYGTPQLLMLSGIGPGPHLREHGIEVAVDAGGVGQNLSEPLRTFIGAAAPPGSGLAWNPDPEDATQLARWRRRGRWPADDL